MESYETKGDTGAHEPFPRLAFAVATLFPFVILAPFANKAYTVDDTLSLWVAEQIQIEPLNFFGFDINWYGTADPAYQIIKNPPGFFYILAAFFKIFGWHEIPVHVAMGAIASVTAAGSFLLAWRLSSRPLLASLIASVSPVFLLASNTVMTDLPMVACYVWAVYLWLRGLDTNRAACFAGAAALIGLGTLIKYFCITALPLLALYTVLRARKMHDSLYYLFIPLFMVGIYVIYGVIAYDVNLLTSAAEYAVNYERDRQGNSPLDRAFVGVIFLGGCLIPVLFFAPLLWRTRGLLIGALAALVLAGFVVTRDRIAHVPLHGDNGLGWNVAVHAAIFFAGGIHVLALTAADCAKRRDAESLLLFCWVFGTVIFSSLLNWTVNGRTLLPVAIPVGILVARQFDTTRHWSGGRETLAYVAPLAASTVVSIAVLWGDFRWSNTQRYAAKRFVEQSAGYARDYYYKGHWGFQYYMYHHGLPAFDSVGLRVNVGDRVVVPQNNYAPGPFNPDVARRVPDAELVIPGAAGVSTMHRAAGAGFYTHFWGPLPYVFGAVPEEVYWVYQLGDYRGR